MWSVQDPIWPPRVLTLEVKVCLETADECQWNVSKVQFVGKLILENHCQHWRFGIVGRADCHPKASVFDLKKMVISKFQVFYPHFYGIVQFRCVDQCCSQDHLNRDQVITKTRVLARPRTVSHTIWNGLWNKIQSPLCRETKTNFKQYYTRLDDTAWLWRRKLLSVWSWSVEAPDYASLKAIKSFNWPTPICQICLFPDQWL